MQADEQRKLIDGLVSVIMPVYNCEKYLDATIKSVIMQTYTHFELIAIDDCSTDNSGSILKRYCEIDDRIKCIRLDKNSGAAIARNSAVKLAKGEFLAFLDSDDLWISEKLSIQLNYMKDNSIPFCCTSYEVIDEHGRPTGELITTKKKIDYSYLLRHCPGNSTVIYNVKKLGKTYIPPIRKRNDYVMWLSVIKKAKTLYGLQEVLTRYRMRPDSLSTKKASLVKFHYYIYKDIEKLTLYKTTLLILFWIGKTIIKRIRTLIGNHFG